MFALNLLYIGFMLTQSLDLNKTYARYMLEQCQVYPSMVVRDY